MAANFQKTTMGVSNEGIKTIFYENNLTEKDVSEAVKGLQDWCRQQPHFPEEPLDDDFLLRFYVASKFRMEKAKETIEKYLGARTAFPEMFQNCDPFDAKLSKVLESVSFVLCPIVNDKQRYRVQYTEFRDRHPDEFDPNEYAKAAFMMSELRLKYEAIAGNIAIWNLKHFQLGHVMKMTPSFLMKLLYITQKCFGAPVNGVYILNMPTYAQNTLAVLKSLMKKKLADRIRVVNSIEELHQYIEPDLLPIHLGGTKYSVDEVTASYFQEMQTPFWVNWFKEAEEKVIDELKRPEKLKNDIESELGIMGSFRKIDID